MECDSLHTSLTGPGGTLRNWIWVHLRLARCPCPALKRLILGTREGQSRGSQPGGSSLDSEAESLGDCQEKKHPFPICIRLHPTFPKMNAPILHLLPTSEQHLHVQPCAAFIPTDFGSFSFFIRISSSSQYGVLLSLLHKSAPRLSLPDHLGPRPYFCFLVLFEGSVACRVVHWPYRLG